MKIERLNTILYAEGFIEDFIENYKTEDHEHAKQLANMWQVLSTGLTELRRENTALELKIMAARNDLS